ncbi:MAG: hypothetical protein OXI34_08690 [Chloroflexota bacterium]|nr:hypothetical protein [Chloroflexota bacterium]MDE2948625.1 hypothetical protein [Chloroflexota bacterium]
MKEPSMEEKSTMLKTLQPYVFLVSLGLILYLPVTMHASTLYVDYGNHINVAMALPGKVEHITHVLYHALVLLIHEALPSVPLPLATVAATLIFMLPVPVIAFSLFKKAANDTVPDSLLIAFSLSLTIMAPLTIWTPRFQIGYINPIVYHNPTMIAVRLFIIPVSIMALRVYASRPFRSMNQRIHLSLLCAVLVTLATMTKPSFTLALLPGCCLYAFWRLLMRRHVDLPILVVGICLPGIFMLGLAYLLTYYHYDDGTVIAVGFLTGMKYYVPTWRIPIQLLLSLAFPLRLYICFHKEARQHAYLNLSWLIFGVGAIYAYWLYEDPRIKHANFLWSGYSAVFLLMFASMLFYIERRRSNVASAETGKLRLFGVHFTRREAFVMLLFGLHVISGIAYYARFLETTR